MALTRSFRETVAKRAQTDPAFRAALVEEAMQNLLDGEIEVALGQIRDVVNATIGFDTLAAETGMQKTSLMRMLRPDGNPRAENLGGILKAVRHHVAPRVVARVEQEHA